MNETTNDVLNQKLLEHFFDILGILTILAFFLEISGWFWNILENLWSIWPILYVILTSVVHFFCGYIKLLGKGAEKRVEASLSAPILRYPYNEWNY